MELSDLSGVGEKTLSILNTHEIKTIFDLLCYYPRTYRTYHSRTVDTVQEGEWVNLVGIPSRPVSHHSGKITTQLATLKDETGHLTLRWFNSPFITRSIKPNVTYQVRGKVEIFNNLIQIVNPELKILNPELIIPNSVTIPVYSPLGTLKSGHIRNLIHTALTIPQIDPLPSQIKTKHQLIDLSQALNSIHFPDNDMDLKKAIRRLSFDELLELQKTAISSAEHNKVPTHALSWDSQVLQKWITNLPFPLTQSQTNVINEILTDLGKPIAMHRLLSGEVGSGKTVVAGASALATFLSGFRTVIMAPTQILAEQLHQNFTKFFAGTGTVSLITSASKGNLDANVIIGTQSLLNQIEKIKSVGLVIIDEQHRFGVDQRLKLSRQKQPPHFLMMTATPIPRTLAMTLFSNLDLSILDELPKNRLPVKTYFIDSMKRESAYSWVNQEVTQNHNQVFIVVPLIELSENNEETPTKSLRELESSLHHHFPNLNLDFMHGKMKPSEKTSKISAFRDGKTQILVATSMIEVGVDIPSANIMIIENAEFFGLATLHQLRGRVGRGGGQGHCLLFTPKLTDKVKERLSYFIKEKNGTKLAEYDLQNRGPGELFGETQHGFFNLKLASIYDEQLLRETADAVKILSI